MKQINDIIKDINKKKYAPIYLLTGEESFFIDSISNYIQKTILNKDEKLFNETIIYGKDTNIEDLLGELKQLPMGSDYRLVLVKEAQQLGNLDKLANYFKNPVASTILVICYKNKTIDKRKSFYKSFPKDGFFLESKKLYENQIAPWIINYVTEKGYKIQSNAAMVLTEFIGNDLHRITNEIGKITLNLPKGQNITTDAIKENVGIHKEYNIFELRNALGNRNFVKTMKIFNHFGKNQKDNPMVLTISSLYSFFCNILIYQSLQDKSLQNVVKHLGGSTFFVKDYINYSQQYPLKKAVRIISLLREADAKSKGVDANSIDIHGILNELAIKILNI